MNTTARPVYCTSRFTPKPEHFPACYMTEISRRDVVRNVTLAHDSDVQDVSWEVQIYSNKAVGALDEAFSILEDVETAFHGLAFIETMCSEMPFGDKSIYRLVARFSRVIGGNDSIQTGG